MTEALVKSFGGETVQGQFLNPYAVGRFAQTDVFVRPQDPSSPSEDFRKHRVNHWRRSGRPWTALRKTWTFPEPPIESDGKLLLTVTPGSFLDFNATRDAKSRDMFPGEVVKVDPVATTLIPVMRNGLLVVGIEGNGQLRLVGGYPEVPNDVTRFGKQKDVDKEEIWDPAMTAVRETCEETGMLPREVTDVYVNGVTFVEHPKANVSLVTYTANTPLSVTEIKGRSTCGEVDIAFLPNTEEAVTWLLSLFGAAVRTSKAAVLLYGRDIFGKDWYNKMNAELAQSRQNFMNLSSVEQQEVMEKDVKFMHENLLVHM